jgi:hypothetical protein
MKTPRLGTHARRSAVKGRGRDAYLLIRLEEDGEPPPFGCLADRTDYARGVVLGAEETWRAGALP